MTSSLSRVLTTGTIIAIVVGSVFGFVVLIGSIIAIVCIVKRMNRSRVVMAQAMAIQQAQSYPNPYPPTWQNQYAPNNMNTMNYPPSYPTTFSNYPPSASAYNTNFR